MFERQFPAHCPGCGKIAGLAPTAQPHCASKGCPWMSHGCGVTYDSGGHFMPTRKEA